jgi:hypothetical protein
MAVSHFPLGAQIGISREASIIIDFRKKPGEMRLMELSPATRILDMPGYSSCGLVVR